MIENERNKPYFGLLFFLFFSFVASLPVFSTLKTLVLTLCKSCVNCVPFLINNIYLQTFKCVLLNKCQDEFEKNLLRTHKEQREEGLTLEQLADLDDKEQLDRMHYFGSICCFVYRSYKLA